MNDKKVIPEDLTLKSAKRLLSFLDSKKGKMESMLILCHNFPDPDTLASAYALYHICTQHYSIQSKIVYGGIIGRTENRQMKRILKIPAKRLTLADFKKFSHFALVDTQPGFKNNSFPAQKRATIVIDQHPADKAPQADFVILDPDCGATSIVLASALIHLGKDIPENIATALAYGILSDTMNLYRVGRADVIQTYLKILPFCNLKNLAEIQNPIRSRRFFITLSKAITNLVLRRTVAFSHLGWVESPDTVAQSADFLLTYKQMSWCLCTGRYKGKLYVSLRSSAPTTKLQAGEVLRDIFDRRGEAGGHGSIGGGSFKVSKTTDETIWLQAETVLVERFFKRLRVAKKGEPYFPFRIKGKANAQS